MRVAYRRQHTGDKDQVPTFLREEIEGGPYERTGFDHDFPFIEKNPEVAMALGYKGKTFLADRIEVMRWFNRASGEMVGSVIFSMECEGPPGGVHGGAVATALDDMLGSMAWRHAGFNRWGIPTVDLNIHYRRFTPLAKPLRFFTRVTRTEGRKIFLTGSIQDPQTRETLAEAEGIFLISRPRQGRGQQAQGGIQGGAGTGTGSAGIVPGMMSVREEVGRGQQSAARGGGKGKQGGMGTTAVIWGIGQGGEGEAETTPSLLPYDVALREFGAANPDAEANMVAFFRGECRGSAKPGSRANL